MGLTDIIATYIQECLDAADGTAELQRNVLAEKLGCVPSQINYVLSSRFRPEQGYIVESRRGGNGFIRVTRIHYGQAIPPLAQLAGAIGDSLEQGKAATLIENMLSRRFLREEDARLLSVAVSDKTFLDVPTEYRDRLRATLLKRLLITMSMKKEG